MGPKSKESVIAALGHVIDELLQQRSLLKRIDEKLDGREVDHVALKARVTDLERSHIRIRNTLDGLPTTPAE